MKRYVVQRNRFMDVNQAIDKYADADLFNQIDSINIFSKIINKSKYGFQGNIDSLIIPTQDYLLKNLG